MRHLWRQSMRKVTVRLRFIETRLKQGYDLRGYFLNLTRETINILAIVVFHYLSWWTFFSSSRREMFSKKGFLKFSQNLKIPFETLRLCYRCLNFVVLLKLVSAIFITSKKLFSFSRYSNFCISTFPAFSPCQPLLESLIQDKS